MGENHRLQMKSYMRFPCTFQFLFRSTNSRARRPKSLSSVGDLEVDGILGFVKRLMLEMIQEQEPGHVHQRPLRPELRILGLLAGLEQPDIGLMQTYDPIPEQQRQEQ